MMGQQQDATSQTSDDKAATTGGTDDKSKTATDQTSDATGGATGGTMLTQADLDRAVTKALATREATLRRETEERIEAERRAAEQERLKQSGKYEELAKHAETEVERLRSQLAARELKANTLEMLAKENLSNLAPVFDADMLSLVGREGVAKTLKELIDARVAEQVAARLKTGTPDKASGKPPETGDLATRAEAARRKGDWATYQRLSDEMLAANAAA